MLAVIYSPLCPNGPKLVTRDTSRVSDLRAACVSRNLMIQDEAQEGHHVVPVMWGCATATGGGTASA